MSNATTFTVRTGIAANILTAAVPGWADLRDTAARLKAETIRRQQEQATPLEERRAISDALLAAQDTDDIEKALEQARTAAAKRDSLNDDLGHISAARSRAETELNTLERGSVHEITAVIRERVEAIADEIRSMKVRPLSAQEAIDGDAADEWKRLRELTGHWQALTSAYSTLVRHGIEGPALSALTPAAFIADPLAHPYFQGRRAQAGRNGSNPRPNSFHAAMLEWAESGPAPKFDTNEPRGGAVPRNADPLEWLVHLVTTDVVAVHEPDHALELWRAAMAATDDISANSAESRAYARVELAKLTGDEDLSTVADLEPVLTAHRPRGRRSFIG